MKSIEESMKDRKDLLEYFGGILPESIMKHNRGDSAINFISKGKGKRSRATKFKEGIKKEFDNGNFDFTIAKRSTPATKETLSMFSQNIGRTLIKLYSKENDIIIDPFAGHNSRMQLCFESNRNYYGQDICHEFMEMNRQVKDILINEKSIFLDKKVSINLFEGDSRKLPWNNNRWFRSGGGNCSK